MQLFQDSSLAIAAQVAAVEECDCAVRGLVVGSVALVDVVATRTSVSFVQSGQSIEQLLFGYGADCIVVSLIFVEERRFIEGNMLARRAEIELLMGQLRDGMKVAQVYRETSDVSQFVVNRTEPIAPENWGVFCGVVLNSGMATFREDIRRLGHDDLQKLWHNEVWGNPPPVSDRTATGLLQRYREFTVNLGWCLLASKCQGQ